MTDPEDAVRGARAALEAARAVVLLGPEVDERVDDGLATLGLVPVREVDGVRPAIAVTADPALVRSLLPLSWVHSPFAGVDRLLASPWPDRLLLTRTTGTMPRRMAEYVVAAETARIWHTAAYAAQQSARRWVPLGPSASLFEREAWVLGTGQVGAAVAGALAALGARVVGVNRSGSPAVGFTRVLAWHDLPDRIPADVLVSTLPSTPATRHAVDARLLARLRAAHVVNVGRGATLDESALVAALDGGQVAHATLDVTDPEPPVPGSPLWTHPGVTLTPHVAGPTLPSDVVTSLAAAREAILRGETPSSAVQAARGY